MRILFQYFSGGGGGLSNVILLLSAYARKFSGDELIIVCSDDSELTQLSSFHNITIVSIRTGRVKEWTRFRLGISGLQRLINEHHPDVVWSLNLGAYRRLFVPNLLAVNNPHQVYPRAITKLHPGSALRVTFLRFFFRLSLRVADGALLQTPLMAEYLRNTPGSPPRIFVVPKAVERDGDILRSELPAELSTPITQARDKGYRIWLYVATALPHKNHKVIIDAFYNLATRGAMECLVLTITADEAIARGGERASVLIQQGILIVAGWVRKEHLRALYTACDCCANPSLLESLSSSHLEAMEWGKPQIVADLPYARDLCGDSAVYVQADSPTAWADMIEAVSRDPALRYDLVTRGQHKMEEFPATWSECATRIRSCLWSLARSH